MAAQSETIPKPKSARQEDNGCLSADGTLAGDRRTIAVVKQADLVVVRGDPSRQISDIRNVELVFRKGVGYSSARLFGAVRGLVGVE